MTKIVRSIIAAATLAVPLAASVAAPAQAEGYHVGRSAYVISVPSYDVLNMRRWPAYYSAKVGEIPHYAGGIRVQRCVVRPHGSSSDWCKVRFHGSWGWVNSRYIAYY